MKKFFAVLFLSLLPAVVLADVVVPSDRVTSGVNIREHPSSTSAIRGLLKPGDELNYLGSVPHWHRVQLSTGEGFVSSAWTIVVHQTSTSPEPGGGYDFWISDALIHKLASQNTIMFPVHLHLTHRSDLHPLANDCELHIVGEPLDATDSAAPGAFVVEPPNVCKNPPPTGGAWVDYVDNNLLNHDCTVTGFPRIWDEHLVGDATTTNPYHMLEIHPALEFDCGGGLLDVRTFLKHYPGMSEILPSSAADCFSTGLWVRRNEAQSRYEFQSTRPKHCGNFASFELSVFTEWIRELPHGGHSAIVRVRPEGLPYKTLKIYTYPGTPADDLLSQFMQSPDPHHGAYLHGMMTFDYFSILKTLRSPDGTWKSVDQWTKVPFPLALVVFGIKQDPNPND